MGRTAHAFSEELGKVVRAHPGDAGQLRDTQFPRQVLADVIEDPPETTPGHSSFAAPRGLVSRAVTTQTYTARAFASDWPYSRPAGEPSARSARMAWRIAARWGSSRAQCSTSSMSSRPIGVLDSRERHVESVPSFHAAGSESGEREDARRLRKREKRCLVLRLVNGRRQWPCLPPRLGPGLPAGPNWAAAMLPQNKSDDWNSRSGISSGPENNFGEERRNR